MREIILDTKVAAVVEDGKLCEYLQLGNQDQHTDDLVLGRVERVLKSMNAAFVDIGEEKNGFLPLQENSKTFEERTLQCGDRVLVQVKRAAHDQKGAFLSRDVSLCGQYVILMPMNRYIGVSSKIGEGSRKGLQALGQELSQGEFGLVFRTAALEADHDALQEELVGLCNQWKEVQSWQATASVGARFTANLPPVEAMLRDYASKGIDRIYCGSSLNPMA